MIRALVPVAALLCAAVPAISADEKPAGTDFDVLPKLTEAIAKADKVVLFEGMPHQLFEGKLLKSELEAKKTVKIGGYPFYAETLDLKDDDGKKLTELTAGKDRFAPFGGEKKCGGFHPDYAVEFHVGQEKYHALFCFGCSEAKLFGPKLELRCDMGKGGFHAILKGYRKNRPMPKD